MNIPHSARPCASAMIALSVSLTLCALHFAVAGEAPTKESAPAAVAKPLFDKLGPQVGEEMPDLRLNTDKGEPKKLSDAWNRGPTLIVTSSLTCPKSRSRWPEIADLEKKYGEQLSVAIVYVIEAHPVGSICPYKGVEDITPENERDGILRKQPQKLEDRLELALEFKRYLGIDAAIYVDSIDNRAWKAFGAAPNTAFLVDNQGFVTARQGWFDGPALEKSIDALISVHKQATTKAQDLMVKRRSEAKKNEATLNEADFHLNDLRFFYDAGTKKKLSDALKAVPQAVNFLIPGQRGDPDETPQMKAVERGDLDVARLLFEAGADVNVDSELSLAARRGSLEMVKLLLSHKADPNSPATGESPLHEALINGQLEIAKLLLSAGAKEDYYSDIALGKIETVRTALAADPSRAARPDGAHRMPLDYAAAGGQMEVAKLLINAGAPVVDEKASWRRVPLHYAIEHDNAALVEFLLKSGHSPNTALSWPRTEPPLHMALGHPVAILKILLSYKPDVNIRDTYSRTALHDAASLGNAEVVKLLIHAGADVKAVTQGFSVPCGSPDDAIPKLETPLHFAAASADPATIKALLAAGASIEARDAEGQTPLFYAIFKQENLEVLISAGAEINAENKSGNTPLDKCYSQIEKDTPAKITKSVDASIALLTKHGAKAGSDRPNASKKESPVKNILGL